MVELVKKVGRWIRRRSKEQLAGAVGAAAVLAYGLLYVVYFQFYTSFGLAPSDVGLTRIHLIEESLIGALLVPVALTQAHAESIGQLIAVAIVVRFCVFLYKAPVANWLLELAATALVAFVALVGYHSTRGYVDVFHDARELGNEVRRDGRIVVDWVHRRPELYYPYLDLQAIPVEIYGDAGDVPLTRGCVLMLGQTDSQVTLFDVRRDLVVRLPVDGLQIVTHPNLGYYENERLPEACIDNEGNGPVELESGSRTSITGRSSRTSRPGGP